MKQMQKKKESKIMAAAKKFDINNLNNIDAFIKRTNRNLVNIAQTFGIDSEYYQQYITHLGGVFLNPKGTLIRSGVEQKMVTYTDSQGKSKKVAVIQLKRTRENEREIYNQRNDPVRAKAYAKTAKDVDSLPKVGDILKAGRAKLKNNPKYKGKKTAELNKEVQAQIEKRRRLDDLIDQLLIELYQYISSSGHDVFTDYFGGRRSVYQSTEEKEKIVERLEKELEKYKTGGGSNSDESGSGMSLDEFEKSNSTYFDIDEFEEIITSDDYKY